MMKLQAASSNKIKNLSIIEEEGRVLTEQAHEKALTSDSSLRKKSPQNNDFLQIKSRVSNSDNNLASDPNSHKNLPMIENLGLSPKPKRQKNLYLETTDLISPNNNRNRGFSNSPSNFQEGSAPKNPLKNEFHSNVNDLDNLNTKYLKNTILLSSDEIKSLEKMLNSLYFTSIYKKIESLTIENFKMNEELKYIENFKRSILYTDTTIVSYIRLWLFFEKGLEILVFIVFFILNSSEKHSNFRDKYIYLKNAIVNYQKLETSDNFIKNKQWQLYLTEIKNLIEKENSLLKDLDLIPIYSEYIQNYNYLENGQISFIELMSESLDIYNSNLESLSSFSVHMQSLKSNNMKDTIDELQNLAILEKNDAFNDFIEVFSEDVISRNKVIIFRAVKEFILISENMNKEYNKEFEYDKKFLKSIENDINLFKDLVITLNNKLNNLKSIQSLSINETSTIRLPFSEYEDDNRSILSNAEKIFVKSNKKLKSLKNNGKKIINSFQTNMYKGIRDKEYIDFSDKLHEIKQETKKQMELLQIMLEYPNISSEMERLSEILEDYKKDFDQEESKEEVMNKLLVLSGKLHNLSLFYNELNEIITNNVLISSLRNSLESQISLTNKYQNFLLKMVNSVHHSELQQIKKFEGQAEKTLEKAFQHYENYCLVPREIEEILKKWEECVQLFDKYLLLGDLPDNYKDICENMKNRLVKELCRLKQFEEIKNQGREMIDNNKLRTIILSLKFEEQNQTLSIMVQNFESYLNSFANFPKLMRYVKQILAKISAILPCLIVFQQTYEHFFAKFSNISDQYHNLKADLNTYGELLTQQINVSLDNSAREERVFFIQCGEFFMVAVKQYFQNVIPESLDHIINETNHLQREIEGRIDIFYNSRDDLKIMAVSFKRQMQILRTIDNFFVVLAKLNLQKAELFEKGDKTKKILKILKENVEDLRQICEVAFSFENELIDDLLKKKYLPTKEKLKRLKDIINALNLKKESLILRKKEIKEERVKLIYVYIIDDIETVNKYFAELMPDIDKFVELEDLFKNKIMRIDPLDIQFSKNLTKLIDFKRQIDLNVNAHQPIIFLTKNKINIFIQTYYTDWYSNMISFLAKFNFGFIDKIMKCLDCCNINQINSISYSTKEMLSWIKEYYENKSYDVIYLQIHSFVEDLESLYSKMTDLENAFFTMLNLKNKYYIFEKLDEVKKIIDENKNYINLQEYIQKSIEVLKSMRSHHNSLNLAVLMKNIEIKLKIDENDEDNLKNFKIWMGSLFREFYSRIGSSELKSNSNMNSAEKIKSDNKI